MCFSYGTDGAFIHIFSDTGPFQCTDGAGGFPSWWSWQKMQTTRAPPLLTTHFVLTPWMSAVALLVQWLSASCHHQSFSFGYCLTWASTPLEHWGGVAGRAPKMRESRRRRRRGEWGLGRGCAPSQKIYEFFISKWCDMVHSGCVVF